MKCPGVYKEGSHIAILVDVGRTKARYIDIDSFGLTVRDITQQEFVVRYKELIYDLGKAVESFLKISRTLGATDRALSYLRAIDGSQIIKEFDMATEDTTEKATKTKSKKTAAKKPATKEESGKRGRVAAYSDGMTITLLVDSNPKREGTASADRFDLYKKNKTVGKYVAAGGTLADVRWDVNAGYISVE